MDSEKLVTWRELPVSGKAPAWMWNDENGRFRVEAEPWRIVGPHGDILPIPGVIWIDRVFMLKRLIALADWRARTLRLFDTEHFSLSDMNLPEPVDVSAMQEADNGEYWILVRSQAQLMKINSRGEVLHRLGSRIGLLSEKRLGFEWPDDALFRSEDSTVLVADSGNDRLVRLNTVTGQFNSFPLPLTPRFILHDGPDGWLVSDGADSLLWGSDDYGPMYHHRGQPMNCCHLIRQGKQIFCADETGCWNTLVVCKPDPEKNSRLRCADLLQRLEKENSDPTQLLSEIDLPDMRELKRYGGKNSQLMDYMGRVETLRRLRPDPWLVEEDLLREAQHLYQLHEDMNNAEDHEFIRVEHAVIGYRLRKQLNEVIHSVQNWYEMVDEMTGKGVKIDLPDHQVVTGMIEYARNRLVEIKAELNQMIHPFEDSALVGVVVRYTLARKVLEALGKTPGKNGIKMLNRSLIWLIESLDILKGDLYLQRKDIDRFKAAYEASIAKHPDKPSLPMRYIDKLIQIDDLDTVTQRLSLLNNRQQDNLNARLSDVYRRKGDIVKATEHLRKELDLFPHRLDLIVSLLEITPMESEELDRRIRRALIGRRNQIDTHYHLGRIYQLLGEVEKALDCFFTECELFPENGKSLLQIKELFFLHKEIKDNLTKEQTERLWLIIKNRLNSCKADVAGVTQLLPFLFILNRLQIGEADRAWLKMTLIETDHPEWQSEIQMFCKWMEITGKAVHHFLKYPKDLISMLEHGSCREAAAREVLATDPIRPALADTVCLFHPEACIDRKKDFPLQIDVEFALSSGLMKIPFRSIQTIGGTLLYTEEGQRNLWASEFDDFQQKSRVWTFSGADHPFWLVHPALQTLLIWDEIGKCLKEIDQNGQLLAEACYGKRPVWVVRNQKGYIVFRHTEKRVEWAAWTSREGMVMPYLPLNDPPESLLGVGNDWSGLCASRKVKFWTFQNGSFMPLFCQSTGRFVLQSSCIWNPGQYLLALLSFREGINSNLSLYTLEGTLLQRIPLPDIGVDSLTISDSGDICLGRRGQWLSLLKGKWRIIPEALGAG